jgi:FAD/FMN-containing dehydrogenase
MPKDSARDVDAAALARALAREIRGEVRFDDGSRALYATDASNYRQVPIGVVLPRDREDLLAAIAVCRRYSAPIVSRGGGTSLAGQTCNAAVVLDTSKYFHRVLEIDSRRRLAKVEPGAILDDLNRAAQVHGFREQIRHLTGRTFLHFAEVLHRAIERRDQASESVRS